jgi:hypothetical protein
VVYIRKSLLCSYSSLVFWAPKREHSFNPIKYRIPILFSLCKVFASDPIKTHPTEDDSHIIIFYLNEDRKGDISGIF